MEKIYLILFISGIWISPTLQANPNPWEHLILRQQADSLKSAIEKLGSKDHDRIITLSEHLQHIADTLDNDTIKAYSIRERAWAYKHKGELSRSILYYFELEKLYQKLQDSAGLGTTNLNIGQIFARTQEYDKALIYLERAKDFYAATGLDYRMSGALYVMAVLYLEKKEPYIATDLLMKARYICPKDKIARLSMIDNLLGLAAKDLGDYTKAREFYKKSLIVLDDSPKWAKKIASAYNNIGDSYLLEEKLDSVDWWLEKALAIKEQLGDPNSSLETLLEMANLAYQRGQSAKALELLDQGVLQVNHAILNERLMNAMALIIQIANESENEKFVPYAALKRYVNIQQRQIEELQDLKTNLDKYSIQTGEGLYAHETKSRILHASLTSNQYKLVGVSIFSMLLIILVGLSLHYGKIQKRKKQHILQDHHAFIRDQLKSCDEKILRMLMISAGYEEIKDKLKQDFGLDDQDFEQ